MHRTIWIVLYLLISAFRMFMMDQGKGNSAAIPIPDHNFCFWKRYPKLLLWYYILEFEWNSERRYAEFSKRGYAEFTKRKYAEFTKNVELINAKYYKYSWNKVSPEELRLIYIWISRMIIFGTYIICDTRTKVKSTQWGSNFFFQSVIY